jgi:ABC-type Fe3+-hydroxamate transport system substrate-binding protein
MSYTKEFMDAAGIDHGKASGDVRIVSLVPSITELLCDLELTPCLVGRTGFCIHPNRSVKTIPKVGGTKDLKLDRIRDLAPTHAIVDIDENRREDADALREFVPNVIVTHPKRPEDNLVLYRLFGGIFDRETQARALAEQFDRVYDRVRRISRELPELDVLYLIWREPWVTVSPETYISNTLRLFNLNTLPRDAVERYPEVDIIDSMERADLVLLSSEPYPFGEKHVDELRRFNTAPVAARLIDGEMVCWYGSRAIAGLEYLTEFTRQHSMVPAP